MTNLRYLSMGDLLTEIEKRYDELFDEYQELDSEYRNLQKRYAELFQKYFILKKQCEKGEN